MISFNFYFNFDFYIKTILIVSKYAKNRQYLLYNGYHFHDSINK